MAHTVGPDEDVLSLPRTEWKDLTEAEDALSKLARVSGSAGAQSQSFVDPESHGSLADSTLFVEAGKARPLRVGRMLLRYLIAACFGVAATLAWQRHGEPVQQSIARWIPQLVWPDSPAIQASVPATQQAAVEPVVAEELTPPVPPPPPAAAVPVTAPPSGVTAGDLADLRRTIERLTVSQEMMAREISNLRAVRQEARQNPKIAAPVAHPQSVAVLPPAPAPLPPRPIPAPPPLD